ncbi:MAG TPA: ABC transporter ATP-binding protein [Firmicutes bacterium]|nr:ABC transporter ATP-binding protein [Bacillota bacterium]
MQSLLKVSHVYGGYFGVPVLKDISFEIYPGEIVALIGLNGAGKSTLIRHLIGLMNPQQGEIRINGQSIHENVRDYRRTFTYIPEMPVLYEEFTLEEHLRFIGASYGLDDVQIESRMRILLKEFRMDGKEKFFPIHFSKGMKQKVMIMSAFLVEPSLYIVDEPFLGLDPLGIHSLLETITEVKQKGAAVFMSTHILSTAEKYCDRFMILHHGRLISMGSLEEIQAQTQLQNASLDEIYFSLTKG